MSESTLPPDDATEALAARLDIHRILIDGQEINPGAAHRALAAEVTRLRTQNAELADRLCECALHLETKTSQLRHAEGRAADPSALDAVARARDLIGRVGLPHPRTRATKESGNG